MNVASVTALLAAAALWCERDHPVTTRDITTALMKARGLNTDDPKLFRLMQIRTTSSLGHWKRRGYLKASPGPGIKGALLWEIADQPQRLTSYEARLLPYVLRG